MKYFNDLKKIIKINSYTQNKKGVDEVSAQMTLWLEELNFTKEVHERGHIGNHILYKSKRKEGLKKILLLGHNDTVFPPDIFEGYKEDDTWIYGPGVCDMKGGNIVALQSLRNIYKQNKEIFNIDFLLVSDEETGSDDSKHLTSKIASLYDYCFVFEAAGKNLEIVSGRKGVGTYTITCEGKASHAGTSYDKGVDANLEASYKLQELVKLTNLNEGITVNVGKVTGGIGANTISPKCELLLELRFTTTEQKNNLLSELNRIVKTSFIKGSSSSLNGLIQREVMEENLKQNSFIIELEKITGEKLLTEKRGGVSDANTASSSGTITLDGFGPFGDGDHTKNERAKKSSFEQRIALMTKILLHFQNNNF